MGNLQLVVAGLQQDKCRPLAAAMQQGCSTIRITPALPAKSCDVGVLPAIASRSIAKNAPVAGTIGRVGLSRREECRLIVTGGWVRTRYPKLFSTASASCTAGLASIRSWC